MINETVGNYRIQSRLGEGGMGIVYKAVDTRLDRPVALKFLSEQYSREPQALERFRQEARAASGLNHPQICTIYDIGEHEGRPFIVMEYLEGQSLKDRIQQQPISTSEVIDIGLQISGALEAAHARGIIHRDIKPANIFLTTHGQVKILDFGLAKLAPKDAGTDSWTTVGALKTTAGAAVGTVAYMSPEQARAEEVDARSDLFSLGVVIYEMATGQQAFSGPSLAVVYDSLLNKEPAPLARINARLPAELDLTIRKALEKDRTLRYQSCSELRTDLERLRRDWLAGRTTFIDVTELRTSRSAASVDESVSVGGSHPRLAFLLGLIPGVGALYNAEYQKAAIQIVVFGFLTAIASVASGAFSRFFSYATFGFYAYMAFDSYHTARIRRARSTGVRRGP